MSIPILGIGQVSALGSGVEALRAGLRRTVDPAIESEMIETPSGSISLPVYRARLDGLSRFVRPRALRRLDRLSRMALYAAHLALEDGGRPPVDPTRFGLVFGTGHGPQATTFAFQDGLRETGDRCASPTLFSSSVHNALASQASIVLGAEGPCQTLTAPGQVTAEVLSMACSWLRSGEVDWVLAGVGDEVSPLLGYGVACAGRRAGEPLDPLKLNECTFSPGEGFVCFLLGAESESARHGRVGVVSVGRMLEAPGESQALFLAAAGDRRSGACYEQLMDSNRSISAHADLYGSMPAGLGFEVALAALDLTSDPERSGGIACMECAEDGFAGCVVVSP